MTVAQIKTLSGRRLHKAYSFSGLTIEAFAGRVRDFHPHLQKTTVKQLTRWHALQKPRHPELVVAAYSTITGREPGFFYTTPAEEDEESRVREQRRIVGELRRLGLEDLAGDLARVAAASEPLTRERVA